MVKKSTYEEIRINELLDSDQLFKKIWEKYYSGLCLYVKISLKKYKSDAEDVAQEIMIKVLRNLSSYKPLSSFKSWFYTIARNHLTDFYRKKKVYEKHNLSIEPDNRKIKFLIKDHNPQEYLISKDIHDKIDDYIKTLNYIDQQICFFRFYENMAYKNISRITGIPSGTLKYKIHEIKKRLKKRLEDFI